MVQTLMPLNSVLFLHRTSSYKQRGNVVILILVAVFLFGALAFTFTRSARDGSSNITRQQAKIAAQEILNYARLVESAVDRVRRNGCSESEISFENDIVGGYLNPNSPTDNTCHIFEPEGGKINYLNPPIDWNDQTRSTEELYNELYFNGLTCVSGIGGGPAGCANGNNDLSELILTIPYITQELCESLNSALFSSIDIPVEAQNAWSNANSRFIGVYTNGTVINSFTNNSTGCFEGDVHPVNGTYHFYHVLLSR